MGKRMLALIALCASFMHVKATEIWAAKENGMAIAIEKNVCDQKSSHNEPCVGATYRHYKGKLYSIKDLAYNSDSDDLELWVVYEALYTDPKLGPNPIFCKPVRNFVDEVEWQGQIVKRFTLETL